LEPAYCMPEPYVVIFGLLKDPQGEAVWMFVLMIVLVRNDTVSNLHSTVAYKRGLRYITVEYSFSDKQLPEFTMHERRNLS